MADGEHSVRGAAPSQEPGARPHTTGTMARIVPAGSARREALLAAILAGLHPEPS